MVQMHPHIEISLSAGGYEGECLPRLPIQIDQPFAVWLYKCFESLNIRKRTNRAVMDAKSAPKITIVGTMRENAIILLCLSSAPNAGEVMYCLPVSLYITIPTPMNSTVWETVHIHSALGKSLQGFSQHFH
jgi:hypothetical protein